jgi:ABC-2 type transport system ATP-binding protein
MAALLRLESLAKSFGAIRAVDGITLAVGRGEVLGFLGPNGAGKSTTMKMAAGFLEPDAGRVEIAGIDMWARPVQAKRRLGYLPEGAPLYGEMTVRGFLKFCGKVRGLSGAALKRAMEEAAERTELAPVWGQSIETLSKGFRRRVGLAQAIMHRPEVLILDEPTDGLDPNQKQVVRGLIRDMAKDSAIIVSTHILEEVPAVCDRVVIIAHGRVVAEGTAEEIAARAPEGAPSLEAAFRHLTKQVQAGRAAA